MSKQNFMPGEIELLIAGYLTGSITEQELDKLQNWISAGSENRMHFNELKDAWILSGKKYNVSLESDLAWDRFKYRLAGGRPESGLGNLGGSRGKADFMKYLKLAASWLLIFSLGSAVTWFITGKSGQRIAAVSGGKVEISTPLGSRSTITLPDSTRIWMNAGTVITYDQDYGIHTRTLNLSGEAYFKVAKDSIHPFVVNTQGIIVRALGTRFNVKAYNDEKTISATLEEGSIAVRIPGKDEKEDMLLKPKDKLIFHKETKETEQYVESSEDRIMPEKNKTAVRNIKILSGVRTELYTSWKDARWQIDREPLSSLTPMLERRFNLKIVFMDEQIRNYKFTGIIENETVDEILNALKLTAPINYKIDKDTIRLMLNVRSREEFNKVMSPNL